MLAYKITDDLSYECIEITQEESINYPSPQWYISETSINWKTHMYVNGEIKERPVIPPDPVIPPTTEELKHIAKLQLNAEYDEYYLNLDRAFAAATQLENPTADITAMRIELIAAHKAAKEVIDNG